jgi:hypothetical protein
MVRIALDTNVMAYAEGVGDAKRCKAARGPVARLPGHLVVVAVQTLGELHRAEVPPAPQRGFIYQENLTTDGVASGQIRVSLIQFVRPCGRW